MGEIKKSTYKELLEDMNKVQKWLKLIGIKTDNTRFEKAKNNFTVIINHFENNDMANINKEMNNEEIIETFSACIDYISIYRNLSKFDKNQGRDMSKERHHAASSSGGEERCHPRHSGYERRRRTGRRQPSLRP